MDLQALPAQCRSFSWCTHRRWGAVDWVQIRSYEYQPSELWLASGPLRLGCANLNHGSTATSILEVRI